MKKILNLFMGYIQNNGSIKILASLVLAFILGILYAITDISIFAWLLIIPGLYLVPLFLTLFIYGCIVWPLSLLFKK